MTRENSGLAGGSSGARLALAAMLLATFVLAGCAPVVAQGPAPAQPPAATSAPAPAAATPAPAGTTSAGSGALVKMVQMANFGRYLVDDQGRTLYAYTNDSANTSNCYDQCAATWPPFLTTGAPQAGTGVTASLLGAAPRKDGTMQVTYGGAPLYYYSKDPAPGDVNGQRVGGVWFVLSPRGTEMRNGVGTPGVRPTATPTAGSY
jgi:predicted lipoprotein with Yx(FWY)xxD motif